MQHRRFLASLVVVGTLTTAGCGSAKSGSSAAGSGAGTPVATTSSPAAPSSTSGSSAAPATSASTSPQDGSVNGPGPCAGLDVKIVPLHGAASGTSFSDLVVVNRGKATCELPGQPEIEYLGADHKPIPVKFSADPSAQPYRLAVGAAAALVIGYGGDGVQPCDTKIAYVRVTPPGNDIAFDGRTHCEHDGFYEEKWLAGSYAAPH